MSKWIVEMPEGWVNGKDCVLLCPLLHMNCATKNCPLASAKKAVEVNPVADIPNMVVNTWPEPQDKQAALVIKGQVRISSKPVKLWATEEE